MTWVRLFVARRISLELVHFIMGGSQEYAGRVSVEGVIQAPSSALSQEVEFDLTADEAAELRAFLDRVGARQVRLVAAAHQHQTGPTEGE